jgi:hypothetical protein
MVLVALIGVFEPTAYPVSNVPVIPVTWDAGRLKAESVVSVELDVAVMLLAVPVVFWFSVGKLAGTAVATEVPLPYRIPVTVVDSVSAGVAPPDDVPAKPLAVATDMLVISPSIALTWATVRSIALAVAPVLLPLIVSGGICASFALVTTFG